jgi:hypothetical protein
MQQAGQLSGVELQSQLGGRGIESYMQGADLANRLQLQQQQGLMSSLLGEQPTMQEQLINRIINGQNAAPLTGSGGFLQQSTGDLTGAARTAAAVRELTRESDTRNMLAESLDKLGRPQEAEQVRNKTLDLQLAQRIVLDEQKLAKEKAIDDQQRSALMRLAVSQNNPRAVEWLKSNGDVSTIASVLLKDPTLAKAEAFSTMYDGDEALRVGIINGVLHKATDKGWEVIPDDVKLSGTAPAKVTERKPTSVAVTKEDKRVYNAVLEENEDIEATISPTWKGTDADLKTILIDKAHQIWKNADPQITREAALRKAAELEEPSDPFADA